MDSNTDILAPQYPSPDIFETIGESKTDRPFIPSEYAHAMGNSFKEDLFGIGLISQFGKPMQKVRGIMLMVAITGQKCHLIIHSSTTALYFQIASHNQHYMRLRKLTNT